MLEEFKKDWHKRLICSIFAMIVALWCGNYMHEHIEENRLFYYAVAIIWIIAIFNFALPGMASKLFDKVVKYRWVVAGIIFLCCIILRIHGSSMEMYNCSFSDYIDQNEAQRYHIIGKMRNIRSDEWMVQTPLFFSQESNDYGLYSKQMSVSGLNMVLCYYAPVKDIFAIGKPFTWGYLIGGNAFGLSWYWCSMMILLFMTAFEMFMILTHKNVKLSMVGMTMIGLSPVMQWWFVPHIPIVFVYGMGLFSIGYHFFTAKKKVMKWLMSVLAGTTAIGFALSIFPSCQVMVAICVFALLVACLYRDKEEITFTVKEWYRIVLPVLFAMAVLLYFLVVSKDDLKLLTSTVYPGKRISVGGGNKLVNLFTSLSSMFLQYKDINIGNNSEVSTYINFAPLFIVLFPKISKKLREYKDNDVVVGEAMWAVLVLQIVFLCAGFPEKLAKITFFSYINRMLLSYGWLGTIFTIWSVYIIWKHNEMFKTWEKIIYPLLYGGIYMTFIDDNLIKYVGIDYLRKEILTFVIILIFVFFKKKHMFGYLVVGMMCFAGLMVNPINRGISPIINHPISNCISNEVKNNPEGIWLSVETDAGYIGNFIMANGAKVLDGTNFYPDFDKWKIIDPDGNFEDCYNRYSNQTFKLTEERTSIKLKSADHLLCMINIDDIEKLGVDYLVTQKDISDTLLKFDVESEVIFVGGNFYIYKLL